MSAAATMRTLFDLVAGFDCFMSFCRREFMEAKSPGSSNAKIGFNLCKLHGQPHHAPYLGTLGSILSAQAVTVLLPRKMLPVACGSDWSEPGKFSVSVNLARGNPCGRARPTAPGNRP